MLPVELCGWWVKVGRHRVNELASCFSCTLSVVLRSMLKGVGVGRYRVNYLFLCLILVTFCYV